MKMYEYKILEELSVHSFYSYQISVVTIADKQNNRYKGIAVLPPPNPMFNEMSVVTGNFAQPFIIEQQQALLLCHFIEEVLNGSLPRKIDVKTNGSTVYIHFQKFIDNWYGGGGYKGKIGFKNLIPFCFASTAIIAKHTLSELKASLVNVYQLDNMGTFDA